MNNLCVIIGKPTQAMSNMLTETFSRESAQTICPRGMLAEHEGKKEVLNKLKLPFVELEGPPDAPNFVYTRDQAIFTVGKRALFCRMRHPERQVEVPVFEQHVGTNGHAIKVREVRSVRELGGENAYFEGGDFLSFGTRDKPRAVLFHSRRSTPDGVRAVASFLREEGYEVCELHSQELHGTSGISTIGEAAVLANPLMVDLDAVRCLGVEVLEVPDEEQGTLAGNAAWYPGPGKGVVVCNAAHCRTADLLSRHGYTVETLNFENHHRGEGNTDCAMGQKFLL